MAQASVPDVQFPKVRNQRGNKIFITYGYEKNRRTQAASRTEGCAGPANKILFGCFAFLGCFPYFPYYPHELSKTKYKSNILGCCMFQAVQHCLS